MLGGQPTGDHRLLQRGWAGELTLEEAEYIAWHLARDQTLRRAWGFRRRKSYPLALIAERAFPEDPAAARRHMAAEQAKLRRNRAVAAEMPPGAKLMKVSGG